MRFALLLLCVFFVASAVGCKGRSRAPMAAATGDDESSSGPSIAILDLSGGAPEKAQGGWLGLSGKGESFPDLIHQVDLAGRDHGVRGVLVRLGTAQIGLARATEIGRALGQLGKTIPVFCHADEYGNTSIYLAALACKRVWVSPASSVDAIGIAAQMLYFHKLLADELGLSVDFLQVGKFKGAEEPFTRDGPSPEARESLESTLSGLRAGWVAGIREGRPLADESAAEDGPYTPQGAKDRGLVDDVGYFDEARSALERTAGVTRSEVRFGPGARDQEGGALAEALRSIVGGTLGDAPVAVVPATGSISMEGGGAFGDGGGIAARRLVSTLKRLERDDDVRAVVLRIDSPGGSALASDLIWHELMTLRSKKALVVSIGDMAASGGYYLASSGATVFADETSIVGSIGVVGGKIAADHALEKIGIHAETFPAKTGDPGAAARAGYESLLTPWDPKTKERVLETMTGIYELFLSRVSTGRNIPVERVAESAEGRIFSGRDGKARGLVDEIGGLREAIARACAMSGLPQDSRVDIVESAGGLLGAIAGGDAKAQSPGRAVAGALAPLAPALSPLLASLSPLMSGETALCALPFALTIH